MIELKKVLQLVETLEQAELEKSDKEQVIKALKKAVIKQDFIVKRTIKDKSIAMNLLETTIDDLQEKKLVIEQQLRDLKASYDELEQFSYIASHDLKSPVRTNV